jgi:diacylglycerol kinase (ATP)
MTQRSIHIIANPGAGQEGLNLKTVQAVFAEFDVVWEIDITRQAGDATALAAESLAAGADVVAIYGGDGSVAEAAAALEGAAASLAILPGGTANVMATELGIPRQLEAALRVAADPASQVRTVDLGAVNGRPFVLRVSLGLEAAMVAGADRTAKDKYGVFAYLWSAAQNLITPTLARYTIAVDGQTFTSDGLTCIVANSGNMGQAGVNLIPGIAVDDGLLDVIVLEQAGVKGFFDLAGAVLGVSQVTPEERATRSREFDQQIKSTLRYWQGREVRITCEPAQEIQCDGELLPAAELHCVVRPAALKVLVPAAASA